MHERAASGAVQQGYKGELLLQAPESRTARASGRFIRGACALENARRRRLERPAVL
jgi:hypothetical protein